MTGNDRFIARKELLPFLKESHGMLEGIPGKMGYLYMGFELDDTGKSILRTLERHVPIIVQQELYFDEQMPEMPCVYILSAGGPHIDGDRYEQHIVLGEGSMAHVLTGAATKLAEMCYNYASMEQTIQLSAGSYLEYLPEPIIPCRGARYISETSITIAEDATLVYAEVFMGGRKYYKNGERFDYDLLSICSYAHRPDGRALFREKFIVCPDDFSPRRLGVMHHYDVYGNVILMTTKSFADTVYQRVYSYIDNDRSIAVGITYLPNDSGLLLKVLGLESAPVKEVIRNFCSLVRQEIKGKSLNAEFPWR